VRHICIRESADKKLLLCLVTAAEGPFKVKRLVSSIVSKQPNLVGICQNINPENTNVIFGKKTLCLWGSPTLTDEVAGVFVELSPVSFFQVNREQTAKLYAKAAEYAGRGGLLLDLYCGTGTIGLSMAENFKQVLGIEIMAEAVENARANARRNGRHNAEFICGDAALEIDRLGFAQNRPDVVVVDPPRKGLSGEIIPKISSLSPERVVYISCNPATLARDAKLFAQEGYFVKRLAVVDMFPRTAHVECVVLMSRVEK
jgi:23S rRNA (uracil1939-C5)-methyltransferase